MNQSEWRKLLKNLRKHFPVNGTVIVVRRILKKNFGITITNGIDFRIYIDKSQSQEVQRETLLHEWAHIKTIETSLEHCGDWGIWYANIYNNWLHNFGV